MREATQTTINDLAEIGGTVQRINAVVSSIAAAIEEQSAATLEIGRSTAEVATGAESVRENIEDVRTNVGAASQAANAVETTSGRLTEAAESLRGVIVKFIDEVRAI
jgi:methyl-accepting chemotaxis protein